MSDLALRRLEAFFIDFFILGFLYMVCMGVVFLTADMRILLGENSWLMHAGSAYAPGFWNGYIFSFWIIMKIWMWEKDSRI